MKRFSTVLISSFLLVSLDLCVAFADWQADMVTRYGKGERSEIAGKVFVQGTKVRLDVDVPTNMSIIHDQKAKTSTALVHSAKIRLDGGFEEYQDRIPLCLPAQIDACFKKLGLKKTKSETVDGEATEVWQGKVKSRKGKNEEHELTIWKPVRLKEVPAVRTLVVAPDGERIETRFSEIATKALPVSHFTIPKGYVHAGEMDQVLKGLKAFDGD